jgi:hypothetical protein
MKTICVDCGSDYSYDPNNPKGASSLRCTSCRKKDTKHNQKSDLLAIAGEGNHSCYKCGYSSSISALNLYDLVEPLNKPTSFEEKKKQAEKQMVICNNCLAEINSGDIKININSVSPKSVSFLFARVVLELSKTETRGKSNVEIAKESDGQEIRRVGGVTKRLDCQPIDV